VLSGGCSDVDLIGEVDGRACLLACVFVFSVRKFLFYKKYKMENGQSPRLEGGY